MPLTSSTRPPCTVQCSVLPSAYGLKNGSTNNDCVAGLLKTAIYAFAGASSVIALPLFVSADKPNNLLYMIISVLVGVVATFVATWILYKPETAEK